MLPDKMYCLCQQAGTAEPGGCGGCSAFLFSKYNVETTTYKNTRCEISRRSIQNAVFLSEASPDSKFRSAVPDKCPL